MAGKEDYTLEEKPFGLAVNKDRYSLVELLRGFQVGKKPSQDLPFATILGTILS